MSSRHQPDPGDEALVAAARTARERALAPYSGFRVGAAIRTAAGHIYTGANVESASYGLTVCAERVALLKALSDGERAMTVLAIAADTDDPTPPCGACRQLLWEYGGDLLVLVANLTSVLGRYRLSALLPHPFEGRLFRHAGRSSETG